MGNTTLLVNFEAIYLFDLLKILKTKPNKT